LPTYPKALSLVNTLFNKFSLFINGKYFSKKLIIEVDCIVSGNLLNKAEIFSNRGGKTIYSKPVMAKIKKIYTKIVEIIRCIFFFSNQLIIFSIEAAKIKEATNIKIIWRKYINPKINIPIKHIRHKLLNEIFISFSIVYILEIIFLNCSALYPLVRIPNLMFLGVNISLLIFIISLLVTFNSFCKYSL